MAASLKTSGRGLRNRTGAELQSDPAGAAPAGSGAAGRSGARGALAYGAYRAAETVVRVVPHRLAYGLGAALAGALVRLQPRRFAGLRDNLRHVLPETDEATLRGVIRDNARNLARCWVDVMEMSRRADSVSARVHPVNVENMLRPLERGRGALCVSLHLGSWELGLAGWNHRFGRMAVLAEVLEPARLFERVLAARGRLGVKVIPIDAATMRRGDSATARRIGASALREVYRTLRENGLVAVAIDRDITGTGQLFSFFGSDAPIPTGVVEVAMRSGAAIVPVVLFRTGAHHDQVIAPCHPEVAYDPQAPRDAEVRRVVGELIGVLEEVIRAHPDQWHVLDPVWAGRNAAPA